MKTIIERGASWTLEETKLLLALWGQDLVQRKASKAKRTKEVYEKISEKFSDTGFERTADQVRTRVFNMIAEYRRILKDFSPERMKKCIFFEALHKIYQAKHLDDVKSALDDFEPEYPFSPASNTISSERGDESVSDSEATDGNETSALATATATSATNNNNNTNANNNNNNSTTAANYSNASMAHNTSLSTANATSASATTTHSSSSETKTTTATSSTHTNSQTSTINTATNTNNNDNNLDSNCNNSINEEDLTNINNNTNTTTQTTSNSKSSKRIKLESPKSGYGHSSSTTLANNQTSAQSTSTDNSTESSSTHSKKSSSNSSKTVPIVTTTPIASSSSNQRHQSLLLPHVTTSSASVSATSTPISKLTTTGGTNGPSYININSAKLPIIRANQLLGHAGGNDSINLNGPTARLPTTAAITSHQLYQAPVNTFDVTSSALLIDRMFAHLSRESENMREWIALEKERLALERTRRQQEAEREVRRERVLIDTLMRFQEQWLSFLSKLDPRMMENSTYGPPELKISPKDTTSGSNTTTPSTTQNEAAQSNSSPNAASQSNQTPTNNAANTSPTQEASK